MKKLLLSLTLITSLANAQTWSSQATGFSDASRGVGEIHIVDANTVWAKAFDGVTTTNNVQEFTRTTNGGTTWTPGIIGIGNSLLEINNLCPVSATTAWVSALIPADGNGVIYKTTDAGATWVQQNASGFQTSGSSFLNGVYFFNANNGIAYGDPVGNEFEIYLTSNGGTTWTPANAANIPNPLTGEYGYNSTPIAAGTSFWFTTNKGKLYRTTDMGVTWVKYNTPISDFGATAINGKVIFSDNDNGILLATIDGSAATPTYKIYTTANGGSTWSAGVIYTGYRLMTYVPGTTTIVATGAGTSSGGSGSAISTNNGVTWTTIDTGAQRLTPAFLNASTGWCGGFSADPFTDGIFKFVPALATDTFSLNNNFKVFPNPAFNTLTISSNEINSYNLVATDISGKIVMQKSISGLENTIDISSLSSGAYFFNLTSENKTETVKIIKN